jgi:hypothetical protein
MRMKRITCILGILTITVFTALQVFGETNWAKTVMYDAKTFRFLDANIVSSNSLVTAGNTNVFMGTQTFFAINIGGVTRTNWPSGVTLSDGSTITNVWAGAYNTLYIVSPSGVYTNKIGTWGP